MAFDFYAHKYDDKITIQDAHTVMSHWTQYDFLVMLRDVRELFRGLAKVNHEKGNYIYSPQPSWKSMDKTFDKIKMGKNNSPEKEIVPVPKLIKINRSKKRRKIKNIN